MFTMAGEASLYMQGGEVIKRMYESEKEDFVARQKDGDFFTSLGSLQVAGMKKGATKEQKARGRAAAALQAYGTAMAKYDLSDPEQAFMLREEMQDVNKMILSMSAGDLDQFVVLARQNGLDTVANNAEAAAGIKRDIEKGGAKKGRRAMARVILGGRAAEYEESLTKGKGKISETERYEGLYRELVMGGADAVSMAKLAGLGDMSKEEVATQVAIMQEELMKQEQAAIEDKKETEEHRSQLAEQANRAAVTSEMHLNKIAGALGASGGLKVKIASPLGGEDGETPFGGLFGGKKGEPS